MFSGWILSIESDNNGDKGIVDHAETISGTFDDNGLLVVTLPDFENPSHTYVLMTAFVADVGYDIDLDNDDVADNTQAFVGVLDAVQVPDTTGEPLYGSQLGG
eukprot:8183647-Prorocentrum_lima.AAC.1